MAEKTVVLLGSLALVGFAVAAAAIHAPRFEARLASEAARVLAAEGLDVEAHAAGREIVLRGRVADDAARRRAVTAVAAVPGVRGVVDETAALRVAVAEAAAGEAAGVPPSTVAEVVDRQAELAAVIGGRRIDFRKYGEELTPEALAVVADVAAYLASVPEVAVQVVGYTDSRGDLQGNYEISGRRAAAVRRALIEHGVAGSRLVAVGRGPERPVADNATAAGRRANRRVELSIARPED